MVVVCGFWDWEHDRRSGVALDRVGGIDYSFYVLCVHSLHIDISRSVLFSGLGFVSLGPFHCA